MKKKVLLVVAFIVAVIIIVGLILFFVIFQNDESKFVGTWSSSSEYSVIKFHSDGTCIIPDGTSGTWELKDGNFFLDIYGISGEFEYSFSNNDETLTLIHVFTGQKTVFTKISDSEFKNSNTGCEPTWQFEKDDTAKTITFTGETCDLYYWEDIEIYPGLGGSANLPTGLIKKGDVITNCNGIITLRYVPENMLVAYYDFSED